jgi:Flp pilus assembly protein CpaB
MDRLALIARRLRRAILRRRRLLAALCAGTAAAAGLHTVAAPPAPTTAVWTAAHDIPGGAVVRPADLARVQFDPHSVPTGVIRAAAEVVGRTTTAPVRSGEPLTDVRLLTGSLLAAYPGHVAAPVRIGDPAAVALLRVGDRVDVISADPSQEEGAAEVVAHDAAVIGVPRRTETGTSMVSGGLVVLAVSESTAISLAAAGVSGFLSLTISS